MNIEELLQLVMDRGGSDLHISAGTPPIIRVSGALMTLEYEPFSPKRFRGSFIVF